jgi:hemoglobin-like flavoprotein
VTPEQIALVEASLHTVEPALDEVVAEFYERLFAADPAIADLFTTDPAEQRRKFAGQLSEIVQSVRNHERYVSTAGDLGARHAGYGVRPSHYPVVGRALLGALAARHGDGWTPELAEAWRHAFDLTAEAMRAGAAAAARTRP